MQASIFVNEGIAFGTFTQGTLTLYVTSSTDFSTVTMADTVERLRNPDISWSEGAFNTPADAGSPFDIGWGTYDPMTHGINGTRIFIIKLRNGLFKKLMIESLIGGVYTFKWAAMNGGGLTIQTIDQNAYNKNLVFFSLANNAVVNVEPPRWDILFTRYTEKLDAGNGTFIEYNVGGGFIAPGVWVAQANGVDPNNVSFSDHQANLTDSVNVIGHDWRYFDIGSSSWITLDDRAYFVKTASDSLFKVVFLDFEGSTTGLITLEKTYLGQYVGTPEPEELNGFALFPNPAAGRINLTINWQGPATDGTYRVMDLQGRVIARNNMAVQPGSNQFSVELNTAPGWYVVEMILDNAYVTEPLIIR